MFRGPHVLVFCSAIAVLQTAFAADRSGCIEPLWKTDRAAIIAACTAELSDTGLDPKRRLQVLVTRGRAFYVSGRLDEAGRDFDAAITLAPDDPDPRVRRGWVALAQKDYKQVGAIVAEVLKRKPDRADAYDLLGVAAGENYSFDIAKAAFDKAVALEPKRLLPRYHRFQFYKNVRAQQAALAELDELIALNLPELDTMFDTIRHRDMSYRTMVRLERATMLVAMGRTDEALEAYDEWVKIEPGPVSFTWRGWFKFDQEEFDQANADLKQAASYDPAYWLPYNLQGWVAAYSRQYESAVPLFTAAIERQSDAATAYWGRAIALRELKRTDEATKDAVTALTVDRKFLDSKVGMLTKLGYLHLPKDGSDRMPAVRDAAQACMLDEKCW